MTEQPGVFYAFSRNKHNLVAVKPDGSLVKSPCIAITVTKTTAQHMRNHGSTICIRKAESQRQFAGSYLLYTDK